MKTLAQFTAAVEEKIYDTLMLCRSCVPKSWNLLNEVISQKLPTSSASAYVRFQKISRWLVCRSNHLSFAYCLECYLFVAFQGPFPWGMTTFFKRLEKISAKHSWLVFSIELKYRGNLECWIRSKIWSHDILACTAKKCKQTELLSERKSYEEKKILFMKPNWII